MATEMVATKNDNALAALDGFTAEQKEILRNNVASPDFTDDELRFCMGVAKARNLDPFQRQIYFSKRRNWIGKNKPGADREGYAWKVDANPTIDGFRAIADRTGEVDGYDDPLWCGPDGQWVDVWLKKDPPAAAKVRVYRKGRSKPCTAIAKFEEYAAKKQDGALTSMWIKMPANQLAKCAEALALRKAFPEQFGELYSKEEMEQADNGGAFANIPAETKPELAPPPVDAKPIGGNVLPMAKETKPKATKAKKWTPADPIPGVIMNGLPPPMRELKDIPLAKMAEDDLELVAETGAAAYSKWKAMPGTLPKLLELLQAITVEATLLLKARRGESAPPPSEAPPINDDSQAPTDYDPATGEVHS